MFLSGIKKIQIGYEAVTDNLLKKMGKKQSLSDNLLLIKFSLKYGIKVSGANLITDLVNEEKDDIMESINNLHFFRFFLNNKTFKHNIVHLAITRNSMYYKMLPEEKKEEWTKNRLYYHFSSDLFNNFNRFTLFEFQKNYSDYLWEIFEKSSNFYIETDFKYKLISYNGIIEYKEYIEDIEIKSLLFEEDYYWAILQIANDKVVSLTNIVKELKKTHDKDIPKSVIISQINELTNEYILYANKDYSNIVSIIDTTLLLN